MSSLQPSKRWKSFDIHQCSSNHTKTSLSSLRASCHTWIVHVVCSLECGKAGTDLLTVKHCIRNLSKTPTAQFLFYITLCGQLIEFFFSLLLMSLISRCNIFHWVKTFSNNSNKFLKPSFSCVLSSCVFCIICLPVN